MLSTPSSTNSADLQPAENGSDTGADGLASASGELLLPPAASAVYQVGDYLIGDAEDAKLGGHPDIRY